MTFAAPFLLFALIAVPLAALGYALLEGRRSRRAAPWARRAMLPNVVQRPPRRLRYIPAVLYLLCLTFLLVGFARPERVLGTAQEQPPTIVLALDVSGSMAAHDVAPTRLRAARALAIQFVNELPPSYRVAVLTFGNTVRITVPPTFDHHAVIAGLPTTVTPRAGTAIGDAISHAVAVIVNAAGGSEPGGLHRPGAVLLVSDGGQTAGGTTLANAAVSALVDYVPVDTVALGTSLGSVTQPVTLNDLKTFTQIPVPVQRATLRTIAQQTSGRYFDGTTATRSPDTLGIVYSSLRSQTSHGRRTQALSAAAGGVALVLAIAAVVLSGLWFGRVA